MNPATVETYTAATAVDSDQINADDLLAGDLVVTLDTAHDEKKDGKRRLTFKLEGDRRVWRTCKATARVLLACWGAPESSDAWKGRRVHLYREPSVVYGGKAVGGVRIRALSHMDKAQTVTIRESRTRTVDYPIGVLKAEPPAPTLDSLGLTVKQIDAWRAGEGKSPFGELTVDQQSRLIAWLAADEKRVAAVREAA